MGLSARQLREIDQELKEAVCDALVNLTVASVSGSGADGEVLHGISPRRSIVSGQLLPRFDEGGVSDETSDIRIAAIGLDFQVSSASTAQASATPRFSVYVRVLPDWQEVNGDNEELEIDFKIQKSVQDQIDQRIRQLRQERLSAAGVAAPDWPNLNPQQRRRLREQRDEILNEVRRIAYAEQGITLNVSEDQWREQSAASDLERAGDASSPEASAAVSDTEDGAEARLRVGYLIKQGRQIPFSLLESARPPAKWRRIDLDLPAFSWPLNSDEEAVGRSLEEYNRAMRQAANDQVVRWLRSDEGQRAAGRDVWVQPRDCVSENDTDSG